jgi:hypothetical protein
VSLPGNSIPPEAVGPGQGTPPAARADLPPFWDGLGVRWDWVADKGGYVCEDPEVAHEAVQGPGAVEASRQPTYGHPPNEAQLAAREIFPDER